MKLSKFELKEAKRSGVTIEHLREYHAITPCDCGKPKCKGWQVRYKFGAERKREAGRKSHDPHPGRNVVSDAPLYPAPTPGGIRPTT